MKINSIIVALMLVFSLFLVACGSKVEEPKENTAVEPEVVEESEPEVVEEPLPVLQVYTTIFPLMDFVQKIGGEYVEVKNIVPVGADAHTFEPSPKTMVDISNAHLYIYNGAGIEGFADAAAEVLKTGSVKILRASEGIELIPFDHDHDHDHGHDHGHSHSHKHDHKHDHKDDEEGHEHDDHHHGEEDPHVWLDPIRAIQIAENIKNALAELLPEASENFESNYLALKAQLEELDDKFQAMLNEVSKDTIVVSHAGYGYWTYRYGIKQVGISGISPTNEPSIRQIKNIIHFVEKNNINYIIFEQNIPTNIAETVRSQVGADALWLHNLEALIQDDVTNNEDYFSLMERNIETLKIALQ